MKGIVEQFPANRSNSDFLNGSRIYISLNDFAIKFRWIPEILDANEILVNYFSDTTLYEELKNIEAFGGPSAVMQEDYARGNAFGGLDNDLSRTEKIAAIDSHLEQIENLIPRIKMEITASEEPVKTEKSTTSRKVFT